MASKENKRNRNMKPRLNGFNSLNKNSRVVNFGSELLTNTDDYITIDSARGSVTKTDRSLSDILGKDDKDIQQYVLACVRRNNMDNITSSLQENEPNPKSAITNGTQTVNEARDKVSSRKATRQRSPESYSRKISELGNKVKSTEDTLDDAGVFRTDGVGGKSVSLSNTKPKQRLSLQETDSFKSVLSNGRPSSLPLNKPNLLTTRNRACSVLAVTSKTIDKHGQFRNRSKSDLPHLLTFAGINKHPKQQIKKTIESILPKSGNKVSTEVPLSKPVNAWSENKVEMVSVATQTEEEYTGQLLYVDEVDDYVCQVVKEIDDSVEDTAKTDTEPAQDHRVMEEAMKITSQKLTKTQIKGIKAAFAAIDLNHDGKISANELRRACKQLGILLTKDEVDEIMLEADTSGNGTIEYDEFEKAIGKQLVIANYKTKQLREAFGKFDKDGDGYITAAEIRTVFRESGVDLDDDEINELVAEADENGDGVISFEEFVNSVCEKDW